MIRLQALKLYCPSQKVGMALSSLPLDPFKKGRGKRKANPNF